MKILEMAKATSPLSAYARMVDREPLIVTDDGKPVSALVSIAKADLESLTLSMHPRFLALIDRSRARHNSEGGISSDEMRRCLGIKRAHRRR